MHVKLNGKNDSTYLDFVSFLPAFRSGLSVLFYLRNS